MNQNVKKINVFNFSEKTVQVAYSARVLWLVARELQCNSLNVLCSF